MSISTSLTDFVTGWCQEHGWTDLFIDHYQYWAFPPGAVMPMPVPATVFQDFRTHHQPANMRAVSGGLLLFSALSLSLSWLQQSPMPLVLAFCGCALVIAFLDDPS